MDAQAALGPGFQHIAPTGIAFDRRPAALMFDQVTSVLTYVAATQSERTIPFIKHHDHGRSTVVTDVVFADEIAGGVRIDTMCSLFANEDYFFAARPPMALSALVRGVRIEGLELWRLRFSPNDTSNHAELRSWADGEGFRLKAARQRIQVQRGATSVLRSDLNDETSALLHAWSWHAAITIRSPATKWMVTVAHDKEITLSGTLGATDEDALDKAGIEVTVESPGAQMRFASETSFEPRKGPLVRVSYPVETRDYCLRFELKRLTEPTPKPAAPPVRVAPKKEVGAMVSPAPANEARAPATPVEKLAARAAPTSGISAHSAGRQLGDKLPSDEVAPKRRAAPIGAVRSSEPTLREAGPAIPFVLLDARYSICRRCGQRVSVRGTDSHELVCKGRALPNE